MCWMAGSLAPPLLARCGLCGCKCIEVECHAGVEAGQLLVQALLAVQGQGGQVQVEVRLWGRAGGWVSGGGEGQA